VPAFGGAEVGLQSVDCGGDRSAKFHPGMMAQCSGAAATGACTADADDPG
jgi:hypothetical protein